MGSRQEQLENLYTEIKKLSDRYELSKTVSVDYYEPGMMEYLDKSFGSYNETTGEFVIRFESKGARYDGRTEQIEKVQIGDSVQIVRDKANEFNSNNFMILTMKEKNVGNMPAELCNAIAPLFDENRILFHKASVSYVEPISTRSRHAKQAILFVELSGRIELD